MSTNAERFYRRMNSLYALTTLIGTPEDADFDCKVWPDRLDAARGTIAKAACGFANANGGVIVIGVEASGRGADTPDVVRSLAPLVDCKGVGSEALDIILKYVEPGIEGVKVKFIPDGVSNTSGFVLIFIPNCEGAPRRSKVDWKFYVRIASGTLPMEYFQIEDMFGRRPHARLVVQFSDSGTRVSPYSFSTLDRFFEVTVKNEGRGLARFPALRCQKSAPFFPSNHPISSDQNTWHLSQADSVWHSYRGSANDVVYPGESLVVATLIQRGTVIGVAPGQPMRMGSAYDWKFPAAQLKTEVMCEGMAPRQQSFDIAALDYVYQQK